MAALKDTVEFYWDPVCAWCWITSRWMVDVSEQKHIRINWKLFSLKKINEDRFLSEQYKTLQAEGLLALRVAAAVHQEFDDDGVGKLYTAMGAHWHHDKEDFSGAEAMEGILKACGLPEKLGVPMWVYHSSSWMAVRARDFLVLSSARRPPERLPWSFGMR